jgi:hypothetical protein
VRAIWARTPARVFASSSAGEGEEAEKIIDVVANNRKHAFEVRTRRQTLMFPYAKADPSPTSKDRVEHLLVDPELRREGFTYRLTSVWRKVCTSRRSSNTTTTCRDNASADRSRVGLGTLSSIDPDM